MASKTCCIQSSQNKDVMLTSVDVDNAMLGMTAMTTKTTKNDVNGDDDDDDDYSDDGEDGSDDSGYDVVYKLPASSWLSTHAQSFNLKCNLGLMKIRTRVRRGRR